MPDYKRLYHVMFNAATDALEAVERRNYGQAAETLARAQQDAEELYLGSEERRASEPGPAPVKGGARRNGRG